jgi:hypothetical protein
LALGPCCRGQVEALRGTFAHSHAIRYETGESKIPAQWIPVLPGFVQSVQESPPG